jgi:hypothetical protein
MNDAPTSRAAHYRALALDAYEAAKVIEDPYNKRIIQRVAMGYENLATNAEARQKTGELVASILTPKERGSKALAPTSRGSRIEAAPRKGDRRIPATSPFLGWLL